MRNNEFSPESINFSFPAKELGDGAIVIRKFSSERPSNQQLTQTAQTFAEVFAGYPWYEASQCSSCEQYSPQETLIGQTCPHCEKGIMKAAYPLESTVTMLEEQLTQKASVMYLAEQDGRVAGFVWGNLRTAKDLLKKFDGKVQVTDDEIFSASEIGILSSLRGKGIGKTLLRYMMLDATLLGKPVSVWTRSDTVLTPICLKYGFTQVFGPEVSLENGVSQLTGNVISAVDEQTPERVFFVKRTVLF